MQAIADRPADHAPGEEVDYDCQIQPPLAGPDVGDVCTPLLVRCSGGEVLVDEVGRHRPGVLAVGRAFEALLLASSQAVVAHQPGCAAATRL